MTPAQQVQDNPCGALIREIHAAESHDYGSEIGDLRFTIPDLDPPVPARRTQDRVRGVVPAVAAAVSAVGIGLASLVGIPGPEAAAGFGVGVGVTAFYASRHATGTLPGLITRRRAAARPAGASVVLRHGLSAGLARQAGAAADRVAKAAQGPGLAGGTARQARAGYGDALRLLALFEQAFREQQRAAADADVLSRGDLLPDGARDRVNDLARQALSLLADARRRRDELIVLADETDRFQQALQARDRMALRMAGSPDAPLLGLPTGISPLTAATDGLRQARAELGC